MPFKLNTENACFLYVSIKKTIKSIIPSFKKILLKKQENMKYKKFPEK